MKPQRQSHQRVICDHSIDRRNSRKLALRDDQREDGDLAPFRAAFARIADLVAALRRQVCRSRRSTAVAASASPTATSRHPIRLDWPR